MKRYLSLITAALSITHALHAAEIVIYRGTYTEKDTYVVETDYETPAAVSTGSKSITTVYTYYLIIDLTNQTVLRINYEAKPTKLFDVSDENTSTTTPDPVNLGELIETMPVKPTGTVKKSLWSTTLDFNSFGPAGYRTSTIDLDSDADTLPDMELYSTSAYITGIGGPFILSKSPLVQIEGVPTKLSGPTFSAFAQRLSSGAAAGDPKEQFYDVYSGKQSLTLDSTLTKAANLNPIVPTLDIGFGVTSLTAGTLANGTQQVANALKKLGFNLSP
jgi:hypothetical protein